MCVVLFSWSATVITYLKVIAKVRAPAGIQRERRLVLLRGRNACGEHGTNFGPGQREEFEPPSSIFGTVYRRSDPHFWSGEAQKLGQCAVFDSS